MSYFDYLESRRIAASDPPFYALLMAAMAKADSTNAAKLRAAFPATWAESEARYNAPGGKLPGDGEVTP